VFVGLGAACAGALYWYRRRAQAAEEHEIKKTPEELAHAAMRALLAQNLHGKGEFKEFYVVTVYTPNAKEDLSRLALRFKHWDPAFLAYCRLLDKTKPVILCGDLNVAHTELDLANPQSNRGKKGFTDEERKGFQNFMDAGFVDTFRLFKQGNGYYSWWSHFANSRARNIGWRIDYFLVSVRLRDRVVGADIHPDIMGSDHCPVSITLA
jgi:exodeoxyribonuclease-3